MSYEVLRSDGRPIKRLRCEVATQAQALEELYTARVRLWRLVAEKELKHPHPGWLTKTDRDGVSVPVFAWSY